MRKNKTPAKTQQNKKPAIWIRFDPEAIVALDEVCELQSSEAGTVIHRNDVIEALFLDYYTKNYKPSAKLQAYINKNYTDDQA